MTLVISADGRPAAASGPISAAKSANPLASSAWAPAPTTAGRTVSRTTVLPASRHDKMPVPRDATRALAGQTRADSAGMLSAGKDGPRAAEEPR